MPQVVMYRGSSQPEQEILERRFPDGGKYGLARHNQSRPRLL